MHNPNIAIKVEHLSKCYRLGSKDDLHDTFGVSLWNFLKAPLSNYRKYRSLYNFDDVNLVQKDNSSDIVWALKDVSFDVNVGEIVGIIGVNGAGKSTLLKILSKITPPTSGKAFIRGKVSSLLEVGTGFHPDLTGRENVYLNGTILGMRKKEIDGKFDEIVEFSGVEKFIDTPVKRYSSGMKVRLAFAVAAHLDPEILIIDEVLTVGDAQFQKKCINKMQDVSQQGRTVLFVSHNMQSVTRLCSRTILLNEGGVLGDGPSHDIVNIYLHHEKSSKAEREWSELASSPGDDVVRLRAMRVKTEEGRMTDSVDVSQPVGIEMEYEVLQPRDMLLIYFMVLNEEGICVFQSFQTDTSPPGPFKPGRYVSTAWIPGNLLGEGIMFVSPRILSHWSEKHHVRETNVVAFQVSANLESDSLSANFYPKRYGVIRPLLKWETHFTPNGTVELEHVATKNFGLVNKE